MERDYEDEFLIRAENGYLHLKIENVIGFPHKLCSWGGYDTKSAIEIISSGCSVKGEIYISTGIIYNFYVKLKDCYEKLTGEARLVSYEENFKINAIFDRQGHIKIQGIFQEFRYGNNELKFELHTDQTYLFQTIVMLESIYEKYGDNKGITGKNI